MTPVAAPMVAGGIAILRGLFPEWDAYRIAEEVLGASVPRSDLLWNRALDVGSTTWDKVGGEGQTSDHMPHHR